MDVFANFQGDMEGVTIKVIWVRGPRELVSTQGENVECIVETEVHYVEP